MEGSPGIAKADDLTVLTGTPESIEGDSSMVTPQLTDKVAEKTDENGNGASYQGDSERKWNKLSERSERKRSKLSE